MIDVSKIPNIIKNPSASDIEIQEVENKMNNVFPNVYKDLLHFSNGFSIGGGLQIYGTDEILERNQTWEVDEYAKGFIAVGDDGGGNVFLMSQYREEKQVLVIDSGDMNPDHASIVTVDLIKWINSGLLREQDNETSVEQPERCHIILNTAPIGGLKDLVKIKSGLNLDISTSDLLKGSKNLPFVIVENFPFGKATKLIEKLGPLGTVLHVTPVDVK